MGHNVMFPRSHNGDLGNPCLGIFDERVFGHCAYDPFTVSANIASLLSVLPAGSERRIRRSPFWISSWDSRSLNTYAIFAQMAGLTSQSLHWKHVDLGDPQIKRTWLVIR
jgi:hypothetical protein